MEININEQQRLFVLSYTSGVSCLGFDVVFARLRKIVNYLGLALPVNEAEKGTLAQYRLYEQAVEAARQANIKDTWFDPDTPEAVQRVLERCRKSGKVVRLFMGDTTTGRAWLEEHDTIGTIGRSTGIFKIPLLLAEHESYGSATLAVEDLKVAHMSKSARGSIEAPVGTSRPRPCAMFVNAV